ncbi:MAG: glycosyltransferase family 4 protein [Acidimicrobiia bacterium]
MRVLFISWRDLAHPQAGGSEYVNHRLATGLQERGHEVALLAGGPTAEREYPVVDLGGTYAQYLRAPFAYRRRFRDWDLVVDVENGIPFFSPLWRRAPVVCLVHHVHVDQWAMYFRGPVGFTGRTLEGRVMPKLYRRRLFVAVSRSTAESLAAIGVDPARIRTIEMGCDPVPVTAARSRVPLFLALGRPVPHKRLDLLLALWERVRPVTGGRLVIAGEGPELPRLRAMAGSDVDLLGAVSEADKRRLLAEAWLLVHPAHHEGWGTVIMEAASAGTPTIGFDVPGVRDSVVDGRTGVLAPDDDAFVAAWIELAKDDQRRARLSEGARQRAATFTWDRSVDAFEAVCREAVGSQGHGLD